MSLLADQLNTATQSLPSFKDVLRKIFDPIDQTRTLDSSRSHSTDEETHSEDWDRRHRQATVPHIVSIDDSSIRCSDDRPSTHVEVSSCPISWDRELHVLRPHTLRSPVSSPGRVMTETEAPTCPGWCDSHFALGYVVNYVTYADYTTANAVPKEACTDWATVSTTKSSADIMLYFVISRLGTPGGKDGERPVTTFLDFANQELGKNRDDPRLLVDLTRPTGGPCPPMDHLRRVLSSHIPAGCPWDPRYDTLIALPGPSCATSPRYSTRVLEDGDGRQSEDWSGMNLLECLTELADIFAKVVKGDAATEPHCPLQITDRLNTWYQRVFTHNDQRGCSDQVRSAEVVALYALYHYTRLTLHQAGWCVHSRPPSSDDYVMSRVKQSRHVLGTIKWLDKGQGPGHPTEVEVARAAGWDTLTMGNPSSHLRDLVVLNQDGLVAFEDWARVHPSFQVQEHFKRVQKRFCPILAAS